MGLFNEIRCRYPLPLEGANDHLYQTKDIKPCLLDLYEIREDGTLWHESYDNEDRSVATLWQAAHPDEPLPRRLRGLLGIAGLLTKVNKRWEPASESGEVFFYELLGDVNGQSGWLEWAATFADGRLVGEPRLVEHSPDGADPEGGR